MKEVRQKLYEVLNTAYPNKVTYAEAPQSAELPYLVFFFVTCVPDKERFSLWDVKIQISYYSSTINESDSFMDKIKEIFFGTFAQTSFTISNYYVADVNMDFLRPALRISESSFETIAQLSFELQQTN